VRALNSPKTGDVITREHVARVGTGFCLASTTRGPITVYFAFDAMCSDALRCAGIRSSGGLWAIFHGDNTGSNPVGDANQNQRFATIFARHSRVQKATFLCPFCTLEIMEFGEHRNLVFSGYREIAGQKGLRTILFTDADHWEMLTPDV
jgi:hypothetical protein